MLTNSLYYYILILAQLLNFTYGLEINGDVVLCLTKLTCSVPLKMNTTEYDDSYRKCTKGGTSKTKCVIEAMGFTNEQMDIYDKVVNKTVTCATEEQSKYLNCTSRCDSASKNMDKCLFDCKYKFLNIVEECFRVKANTSENEFKEAQTCSDKCKEGDIGEIFNCDIKCNAKIYSNLDIDLKNYSSVAKFAQESSNNSSSGSASFNSITGVQFISLILATVIFSLF